MTRRGSMPELRWRASSFEMDDVLGHSGSKRIEGLPATPAGESDEMEMLRTRISPVRKSMQHACRGSVQRISLDPKVITDDLEKMAKANELEKMVE